MHDGGHATASVTIRNQFEDLKPDENPQFLAANLLQRCESLLAELEIFSNYLVEQKKDKLVELRHFRNDLKAESKSLEKLRNADPEAPRTRHTLRSSNLSFYAAVWNVAKCSTGVVALTKRVYWHPGREPITNIPLRHKNYSTVVDIVSQDGSEWIKISSVTEKRILLDLAKAGWVGDTSSDEDESSVEGGDNDKHEGLMKQAEALSKSSKALRVRYRHPKVRFLLPKVRRGSSKEVDRILEKIQALGIRVETAEDVQEAGPLADALQKMVVNPFNSFSNILNVDCTVLLALVSDLSHSSVAPEDWFNRAIKRQIEMEKEDRILPNILWPACGSRHLVSTREAVTRMNEIVDTIGTATEKRRRDGLLVVEKTAKWSRKDRINAFQELSSYDVPLNWNLPIIVVDAALTSNDHLPPSANKVMESHSTINKSVFMYGWAAGLTTISSNRSVAKDIETAVEASRSGEDDVGPDIWLCPTARSLVGKEKTKRNMDNE